MTVLANQRLEINDALLAKLKLTCEEYKKIVDLIGKKPNEVELHMFSVMWSEHCAYKNSKPLLRTLPTKNKFVVVGPGENAGVIDLGDGIKVAFKIESHNRPTAIEPFQGATTGVGGILRDIFTMGARPVAILDSLRFGDLNIARTKYLFSGAVGGISHYGNCTGIPNIGGEAYFYPTYNENPLVNAMCIGIMETDSIVKSAASGIGNPVLYVGSKTGRDGIGGASFASSGLTEKSHEDRPAVQVGDPFTEKLLIEACLEAFKTGYIVAAQDMGAAGLTCSTSEMAAKGKVGIEIDLDKVPIRTDLLLPVEYMISESQERMLFVVKKGYEKDITKIFDKWGLDSVQIGQITDTKNVVVSYKGEIVVDVPADALVSQAPEYKREGIEPSYISKNRQFNESEIPDLKQEDILPTLHKLLESPNICSKKWIYRKYDHQVQTNTVIKPGGAAGLIRLRQETRDKGQEKGLAVSLDGNSAYVYLNPYLGSMIAVAEAARNVSCTGALPIAITNNLNFGNPEKPEIYWQLSESVRGIKDACTALDTPVTGGNVSLYNEGSGVDIWPTPVIGMVGYLEDVSLAVGSSFKTCGDVILLLGEQKNEIGASEYLYLKTGKIQGKVPELDIRLEKNVQSSVRELIKRKLINSANDCSIGGLLVTLLESAFPNALGFTLSKLQAPSSKLRLDALLFGETQSRIIVSFSKEKGQEVENLLKELNCPYQKIGSIQEKFIEAKSLGIKAPINELKEIWEETLSIKLSYN
ncbi:MAG: phosphoribosylformylglycinamidine synthase subunit PurL [Candidatus Melainabacteria bacterium]|nr:phosphoribosylformylglycinamidine synthase subunit PurL [Candidatus Melainabacteria bacterium]